MTTRRTECLHDPEGPTVEPLEDDLHPHMAAETLGI